MEQHSILIYILLAIVITNLIRVTPMVLIKGELHNRFVRSFLYYVPYVTLAVTIPGRCYLLRHRLFIDIKADREIWIACTWQRLAKRMNNQCLSEPPDCRGEPSIH